MLRTQLFTTSTKRLFSSTTNLLKTSGATTSQHPVWLTLYAKQGCSLCDKAKIVLDSLRVNPALNKKINYQYVDITDPQNNQWWDMYCFDVPVVHLDRFGQKDPIKFMHYLKEDVILEEINKEYILEEK